MIELLQPCAIMCDAIPDPAVFWTMIGSLATLAAALVAIIGVPLIYLQVRQIREQSATHYAEGIKWLTDFLGGMRFDDLLSALDEAIGKEELHGIQFYLASILADMDLTRHMILNGYVTEEMVHVVSGDVPANLIGRVKLLLEQDKFRDDVFEVIKWRPEAYELMERLKAIHDRKHDEAKVWLKEHTKG